MHHRLRARRSATLATRIQQLATAKALLVSQIRGLQDLIAALPDDVPDLDRDHVAHALETARRLIEAADPACPDEWTAMSPLLDAMHRLVQKVGALLGACSRQAAAIR